MVASFVVIAPDVRAQGVGPSATSARVLFTRTQADAGAQVYARSCASCHGNRLDDGLSIPLVGPAFIKKWTEPGKTLDDLYYITRTTMPKNKGRTLPDEDYIAVLAYMLDRNGYAPGDSALTGEKARLALVHLPVPTGMVMAQRGAAPDFVRGADGMRPLGSGPDQAALLAAADDGRNWLSHTRDYAGTRYSPLSQITSANASALRPSCIYQVSETGNFQTGPVVHDGVMYLTSISATIAIDAATCKEKWRHEWKSLAPEIRLNNRGVAIKDGRVFRGTADGYLLALDRERGTPLWARRIGDATKGETFTMAPLVYDSLVFIGPAIGEFGIRGWVAAYRIDNGERVWRFNIVPAAGEPGSETWKQDAPFPLGGGAVWTPLSLDVAKELLFVSAANPSPDFPEALRGGTNLYTNSMLALHLRTGKLAWYDQMVPNDDHDWDLTQVSPQYRASVNGTMRNLIATVGKDGIMRVVDRDSHSRVFETPVTTILNADAPVTTKGTRACPGLFGGVQWNGPAYHPRENLLITPSVDWCATFFLDDTVRFVPGQMYLGGRVNLDETWKGWVTAVDGSTGKVRWRYASQAPMVGAVTTTAGGVVFAGELSGDFLALDAATGAVRYRFNTGGAIGAGVVTYEVGGTQYVAIGSGRPSSFWNKARQGSPTIVVFTLPKSAPAK